MDEKEFDYINMVPLIDIMLVLLTIVFVTGTFVVTGVIPVEIPKVQAPHGETVKTRTIEISRDGRVFFEGRPVDAESLRAALSPLPRTTPFVIRADRNGLLQYFVGVLDEVKTLGFQKVSVQTERASTERAP